MPLAQRLHDDMKTALKAGQKDRLQVIRMMLSDVKNVDLMPGKPSEESVVEAYGKKLRKSAEEYEKLNRPEEVAKLKFEISVVDEYLPKKASAADTEALVDQFLAAGNYTAKQAGQATGAFMKAHAGAVDAAAASAAIRRKLGA